MADRGLDAEWHQQQVQEYAETERRRYQLYADVLAAVLEQARRDAGVMGIVQARAKAMPSFAEKVIRKAHKYEDPVHQLTDLCAARVITETRAASERICRFIRENFRVDEANSLDVSTRLKAEEFGYLSVHYVVQLVPGRPAVAAALRRVGEEAGCDAAAEIGDRKAEIQVRTLLQHAWAAISHDRLYKAGFTVPARLRRNLARVAALLEEADREFDEAVEELDAYKRNYGAYMTPERLDREIATLERVLHHDQGNVRLAQKIGRLAITREDWAKAIEILEPYRDAGHPPLLRDLGLAKWRAGRDGRAELEAAAALDPHDAEACAILAETHAAHDSEKALELYERAFQLAPSDPDVLSGYLECKAGLTDDIDFISLMHPTLRSAIATCQEWAEVRVNLPWAVLDIGLFALLLNRPYESLAAYARGVALSGSALPIERALRSLAKFELPILRTSAVIPELADLAWGVEAARRFLLLGRATKQAAAAGATEARITLCDELQALIAADLGAVERPVVIVAGGCDAAVAAEMERYRPALAATLRGFRGTLIGGGTTAGISGIVGDLAAASAGAVRAISYLPQAIPRHATPHEAYETHATTPIARGRHRAVQTADFTALEPIQCWIDLLAAGVHPSEVTVVGINGGHIAAFECRMALALGASVGIVESSGRGARDLEADAAWWGPPQLVRLPADANAWLAFAQRPRSRLTPEQLDQAGRAVHGQHIEQRRASSVDPLMKPWDALGEDVRDANRALVAYAEEILRVLGWGVRAATGEIACPTFTDDEVNRMAEMEHGRWIVERLRAGWTYGPRRDPDRKLTPYLVPWAALPDEVKEFARDAVRGFPPVLRQVGLEVYRLQGERPEALPS